MHSKRYGDPRICGLRGRRPEDQASSELHVHPTPHQPLYGSDQPMSIARVPQAAGEGARGQEEEIRGAEAAACAHRTVSPLRHFNLFENLRSGAALTLLAGLQEANISAAGLRQFGTGTAEVLEQVSTIAEAMLILGCSTTWHGLGPCYKNAQHVAMYAPGVQDGDGGAGHQSGVHAQAQHAEGAAGGGAAAQRQGRHPGCAAGACRRALRASCCVMLETKKLHPDGRPLDSHMLRHVPVSCWRSALPILTTYPLRILDANMVCAPGMQ